MLFYDRVPAVVVAGAAFPVTESSPVAAALLSPLTPALLSPGASSPLLTPTDRERRWRDVVANESWSVVMVHWEGVGGPVTYLWHVARCGCDDALM